MFNGRKYENYERPAAHEPGHPDIFVHAEVIDTFGLPVVDYDNQARLHQDEIAGSPDRMPAVYIDRWRPKYPNPVDEALPATKLSHDSYRKGDNIHINLRTFPYAHGQAITAASLTRLNRELITQSAGRAIVANSRIIRRGDIVRGTWVPAGFGTIAGSVLSLFLPELAASGIGAGVAGLTVIPNLMELRETRNTRIRDRTKPVVSSLLERHKSDFFFANAVI